MVDQIPDAAVGFLLENLKEFIQYNSDLIGGLNRNIMDLYDDLDLMKAFIKKYTEIHTDNDVLEQLADDVRKVVHQAEDAIEEYIICETLQKSRNVGSKAVHLIGYVSDLRDIGKQIEEVSAKVTKFYQERAPLGLEALKIEDASNRGEKKKKKVPVMNEDNVVGFEDEANKVIELLTGESEDLEIVSIIGMLGLGKTTLARKVLNDPKVEYEFFTRVFVNVSQEYESREVFINILGALTQITSDIAAMPEKEIIEKLRGELGTRKYLIVMDDVWTPDAWEDLKVAFPNNKKRSRVLITSRHTHVASHVNPSMDPHNLRFMNGDESRELLRRKVFGENECPTQLQGYELRILDKCAGLPLAIVVVAGILLNQRERTDWWEKVAESVNDYVARDQSQSNEVIKLSFNHLPYHLKACFLYLGVFREDYEIPAWKLLRLWIAEGFIQRDGDMTLEDIAEEYVEDLVDRNLVMVGQRRSNGQIKTCRIHDTLRDFCKKEASKQKLFQEIKKYNQSTFLAEHPALQSYRRICINSNVNNYITSKLIGDHVRSFLTFAKEETIVPTNHISSIPKAFRLLRVLDVKSLNFNRFPTELINLVLLKYIAMSCSFRIIPDKFSKLRNLQTIFIETSSRTLEIKADISKLALLRHLLINASTILQKGKLPVVVNANLQTLSTICPESCTSEVFKKYPKLKKLGIRGKLATVIQPNGESILFDTLVKLEFLENLKLINDDTCQLHVLPRETCFPRNLRRLTLMNTFLSWSQISTLGKLQKLEVLKLKDNAFHGELWDTEDGGFRCLKVLHIGYMQNLVLWKANGSHFPILTSLYLRHCAKLEAIPPGIGDIPTLQTIDLYCCAKPSVAASARKIQLLKLQQQAQKKHRTSQFKLAVYPPDQ